jgi:hypothetical protein
MATHLQKCRKNYKGNDMRKCQFNVTHIIPAPEIAYHEEKCSDRLFVLKFLEAGAMKRKIDPEDENPQEKPKKTKAEARDEWDDVRKTIVLSSNCLQHFRVYFRMKILEHLLRRLIDENSSKSRA